MSSKSKVGIIGYGDFTKVMLEYLSPYAEIIVSSRKYQSGGAGHGAVFASLDKVLACPIIIPSIPSQFFEEFFSSNTELINPNALVIDVCSVKVKPLEILERLLPKTCNIIGTHPMFGPASIKKNGGIVGLKCVVSPVRAPNEVVQKVEAFISSTLNLKLLRRSPQDHDKEMAYVLSLSHYIARVMDIMDIPESELSTLAYDELLAMKKIQAKDSWDLFESIMHDNPYSMYIHDMFKQDQNRLDTKLEI